MPKKILVVDDEPDILKIIIFRLKKAGYEVISAVNGKEALECIKTERPGLIVLDYRLPDTDGIAISKIVRADPELKDTPIILISASSGEDIAGALKSVSVNEYIKKPFDPEAFLVAIKKYI